MMYTVILLKRARKFIDKLPQNEKRRLIAAIERLPEGTGIKQMKGQDNLFRLRVADYRVIYRVDHGELQVIVIDADTRGDIYNKETAIVSTIQNF